MLTVENDVNGDSKSTNERGPLVRWVCRAGTRDSAMAALVSPIQHIFFLVHHFNSCVPTAQQSGQAAVLGRLSFNMCLRRILSDIMQEKEEK